MKNELPLNSNLDSQTVLNQIVLDYMKEQKRKRRWRWVTRLLFLLVIAYILYYLFWNNEESGVNIRPHVGLLDIRGEIKDSKGTNADDFAQGLNNAYKNTGLKAVIIRINSPGGSPVQAEYIYNALQYYKKKYPEIKIYAVCVDMCASAAYYAAVAADEIYASPSSIVGSIGVTYNGFGFVDLINKIGVSRRLLTAGANKGFLDAFSPSSDYQKEKLQTILNSIHQQFISRVKQGRGNRLHINDEMFTGLFWSGEQALTLGLIDGFSSSGQLAREKIEIETVIDYTHKENIFDRVSKTLGTALANEFSSSLGIKPEIR
jgi:protease-4